MPPPTTIAVLQHARRLLSHPSHWVHLCDAHDPDGTPIEFSDPSAARWSDLGAIRSAAYRLGADLRDPTAVWPAITAAETALARAYDRIDHLLGPSPQPENDRSAYLATLYAFELAIAHLTPPSNAAPPTCPLPDAGRS